MPYDFTTDTFNLGLHWAGENANLFGFVQWLLLQGHLSEREFPSSGSLHPPATRPLPLPPWLGAVGTVAAIGQPIDAITTPPDNQLHQLNLISSYAFYEEETELAGGFRMGAIPRARPLLTLS